MDNANMVKSTPEDLKRFEDAVRLNLKDLGLMDWDCIFKLEDLETSNAAVRYHIPARKATFRLAQSREEFRPVEEHALHEALELLLAEIAVYLGAYYSDDLINNEVHRVINRLMTVIPIKEPEPMFWNGSAYVPKGVKVEVSNVA